MNVSEDKGQPSSYHLVSSGVQRFYIGGLEFGLFFSKIKTYLPMSKALGNPSSPWTSSSTPGSSSEKWTSSSSARTREHSQLDAERITCTELNLEMEVEADDATNTSSNNNNNIGCHGHQLFVFCFLFAFCVERNGNRNRSGNEME